MKYETSININKPLNEVINAFDNVSNYKFWMNGLESYTTTEGTPLQEGEVSLMVFDAGKRKIEMTKKVLLRNLPYAYKVSYEANKTYNTVESRFEKVDEKTTRYTTIHEFKFGGLMMKIFGLIMPGAFKKQSYIYLNAFKNFVEQREL